MTTAVDAEVLQDFAEIAQVELLSINANTDATEFRKEIRWNSLHYKLSK
jgi:L-arabinose isomerase